MIIMALVVAGLVSFPNLGVDRYPNMDLPSMYVRTVYPGAASQEVESEVSQVIEDAVATVAGWLDWRYHRSGKTVIGRAEHHSELVALAGGGLPLFVLMAAASVGVKTPNFNPTMTMTGNTSAHVDSFSACIRSGQVALGAGLMFSFFAVKYQVIAIATPISKPGTMPARNSPVHERNPGERWK